mgnify:CR=1 FL=1
MAKLTMKSLSWLGKPKQWKKDFRCVELVVDAHTTFPNHHAGLIAATDKNLTATALLSVAPHGGESGLFVFQTDKSQMAMGACTEGFSLHVMVMGYETESFIPISIRQGTITMRLCRNGPSVSVGYSLDGLNYHVLSTTHLPGMESSFSFGLYFANATESPFTANCSEFRVVEDN